MSSEPPPPPAGDVSAIDTPSQPQTTQTTQSTDTDSQTPAAPPASKQPAATTQQPAQVGDVTMAEDIRAEVEREQALADLQRKVGGLEDELSKCREEVSRLEGEKDGAGECWRAVLLVVTHPVCFQRSAYPEVLVPRPEEEQSR